MVSSEPRTAPAGARNGAVPQDVAAERAVIGAILAESGVLERVAPLLMPPDFIDPRHRLLFAASLELWDRGEAIDPVTVGAELARRGWIDEVGGQPYITHLVTELPTTVGAEHYARVVQRAATYRDMLRAAGEIGELAYRADPNVDSSLTEAVEKLYSVRGAEQRHDFALLQDLLADVLQETTEAEGGSAQPTRTGFGDLDQLLNGGMHASDLVVLAARPAVGKSALALTIARNAALGQAAAVAMFSLEMSAEQVAARLVSAESGVENSRLRVGQHTDEQQAEISRAIGLLSRAEIYIDDTAGQTLAEIRAKSRNLHKRLLDQRTRQAAEGASPQGLGLIVVDHIQLVHGWSRTPVETNRVAELSVISRTLKEIARELHVPVLALSQLSRAVERRRPPVPMLSDLRESGSIEQDADVVVFIYRADMYEHAEFEDEIAIDPAQQQSGRNQVAQLLIAKHRHGAVGAVDVRFVPQVARFEDFYVQDEPVPEDIAGWDAAPSGNGRG